MFSSVIPWYFSMQLLFAAALPLTLALFDRLHDRGYAAAKAIGLLLTVYLTWLLSHNSTLFGLDAGFRYGTVFIAAAMVAALSIVTVWRTGGAFREFFTGNVRLIITYEVLFAAAFLAMAAFRAEVPHISYHTSAEPTTRFFDYASEKFTDFAMLNSLLTSETFPPHDAWLAGRNLNYYYFGHLLWATLIRFSGVPAEIGYNLGLAGAFALAAVLSFSLGFNLTRRLRWGALSLFLILLASNADGFLQLVALINERVMPPTDSGVYTSAGEWYKHYDFWRSSRAVEHTINEFPAFSYILGDLHAHLSSFVIYLTGLLLCLQVRQSARAHSSLIRFEVARYDLLFFAALIIGCLSAANSWDVITFAAVFAGTLWAARVSASPADPTDRSAGSSAAAALEALFLTALLVLIGTTVFMLPFQRAFDSPLKFVMKLLPWRERIMDIPIRAVMPSNRSHTLEFVMHWILIGAAPAVYCIAVLKRKVTPVRSVLFWCAAVAFAFVAFPLVQGWTAVLLIVVCAALGFALIGSRVSAVSRLVVTWIFIFSLLCLFCELFYLNDIFDGEIERINTVFKIYYGLWPLLVLCAIPSLRRLIRMIPPPARVRRGSAMIGVIILIGGVYPVMGTVQRITTTDRFAGAGDSLRRRLDGLEYLRTLKPEEYLLIHWIKSHLPQNARILEAVGTQYTYNGRIGTLTGRPSFGGWLYHEWGWRGHKFVLERNRRIFVGESIYSTSDAAEALIALTRHGIDYVVVGAPERAHYPLLDEEKFRSIAEPVFERGGTTLYKVRHNTPLAALKVKRAVQRAVQRLPNINIPDFMQGKSTEQNSTSASTGAVELEPLFPEAESMGAMRDAETTTPPAEIEWLLRDNRE